MYIYIENELLNLGNTSDELCKPSRSTQKKGWHIDGCILEARQVPKSPVRARNKSQSVEIGRLNHAVGTGVHVLKEEDTKHG